jgi:hypothetical protein
MIRETALEEFTVVVRAKQKPDGLWVADIRTDPEPLRESLRGLSRDVGSRAEMKPKSTG